MGYGRKTKLVVRLVLVIAVAAVLAMASVRVWAVCCNAHARCAACEFRTLLLYGNHTVGQPIGCQDADTHDVSEPSFSGPDQMPEEDEYDWLITLHWGKGPTEEVGKCDTREFKRCFFRTGVTKDGEYFYVNRSNQPDDELMSQIKIIYKSNPGTGDYHFRLVGRNGYEVGQNSATVDHLHNGQVIKTVTLTGTGAGAQVASITQGTDKTSVTTAGAVKSAIRQKNTGTEGNPTWVALGGTYTRTSADGRRKRVTTVEYNTDGTTRIQTWLYFYDTSGRVTTVVDPDGVRRFIQFTLTADYGVVASDPGAECSLDSTTAQEVAESSFAQVASAKYTYDETSGRMASVEGSSCCGGGTGKILYRYGNEFSGSSINTVVTYRRSQHVTSDGDPIGPRVVEFLNSFGQVIYHVEQTMDYSASPRPTLGMVWVTHYVYYEDNDYRKGAAKEIRYPRACWSASYACATEDVDDENEEEAVLGQWVTSVTPSDEGTDGRVRLFDYHNPSGQLLWEKVRQGTDDDQDAYYVVENTYGIDDNGTGRTYNGYTTYPVRRQRTYVAASTTSTSSAYVETLNEYTFQLEDPEEEPGESNPYTQVILERKVTQQAVAASHNGSGTPTVVRYHYNADHAHLYWNDWTKHEDGTYSYTQLGTEVHNYGQVIKTITDVDTDQIATTDAFPGGASGTTDWPLNSNGLHLTTTYEYYNDSAKNNLGQPKSSTDPSGMRRVTATSSQKIMGTFGSETTETTISLISVSTPHMEKDANGTDTYYSDLPVTISVTDLGGRSLISAIADPSDDADGDMIDDLGAFLTATNTDVDALASNYSGTVYQATATTYDDQGKFQYVDRYHDDCSIVGELTTSFYRTVYKYDALGRQEYVIEVLSGTNPATSGQGDSCVEKITQTVYDSLGRVSETWVGSSGADHAMDQSSSGNDLYDAIPTLTTVSKTFYDEATPGSGTSGVGDGLVTSKRSYFGSGTNDYVGTEYRYDYLGRQRGTYQVGYKNSSWVKVPPFEVTDYDNMGRVTYQATYSAEPDWSSVVAGTTSTSRRSLSQTYYDERGQVWKNTTHEVQANGSLGSSLSTEYWYDAAGRTIKVEDPTGLFAKTTYDGAGRTQTTYSCFDADEDGTDYTEADDVDGDTVLWAEFTQFETYTVSQVEYNSTRVAATWVGTHLGSNPTNGNPNHNGGGADNGDFVKISVTRYDAGCTGGARKPYVTGRQSLKPLETLAGTDADFILTKYEYDGAGRVLASILPDPDGVSGALVETRSAQTYDALGRVTRSDAYKKDGATLTLLARNDSTYCASGIASQKRCNISNSEYIETTFAYDGLGRQCKTTTPGSGFTKTIRDLYGRTLSEAHGTAEGASTDPSTLTDDTIVDLTEYVYDCLGRVKEVKKGTDNGVSGNMVVVSKTWFDSSHDGSGTEQGRVTGVSILSPTASTSTFALTTYEYDTYGRDSITILPDPDGAGSLVAFKTVQEYDAQGRPSSKKTYKMTGTPTLISREDNVYTDVRLTSAKEFSVVDDTVGNALVTSYEYGYLGQVCKVTKSDGSFTKTKFAKSGAAIGQYFCAEEGTSTDPTTLTDDIVVTQTVQAFDDLGRRIQTTRCDRWDGDTTSIGALGVTTSRPSYSTVWYNDLGLVSHSANYGDNGGASFTRPTLPPDPNSTTVMVTKQEYDGYGRLYLITDNAEKKTKYFFDASGRKTHVAENWVNFAVSSQGTESGLGDTSDKSEDRVTKYAYNDAGQMTYLIALDPDSDGNTDDNQNTRYVYAAELSSQTFQPVVSGTRLAAVIYPDSDDTVSSNALSDEGEYDRVEFTYYADGSLATRKDQRQVVHTYTYDDLARQTKDAVTLPSGSVVDSTILAIASTYNADGRKEKITSWSDAAATGTVRNEVSYTFNGFGLPVREYQEHEGAVDANTPYVLYGYDTTVSSGAYTKGLRLSTFGYPGVGENRYTRSDSTVTARTLHYLYADAGDTNGLGDKISRVTALSDASTRGQDDVNVLAAYTYLGRGTIVAEDYVNEGLSLSYKGATPGTYTGLDRFGRVVDQKWTNIYDSSSNDEWRYTYDAAGNPIWRDNAVSAGKSSQYSYDGLHRLRAADQGTTSGTWPSVTLTKNYGQAWTLDQVGNWPEFKVDANGDADYADTGDLDQNRTHNAANEITGITEDFGSAWKDPTQDAAGNLTVMAQPLSPTGQFYCVYDAWNRMTQVVVDADADGVADAGETVTGEYEYDGLNRRVRKHRDTLTTDYNLHFYYNTSWQILEIRRVYDGTGYVPETRPAWYQYVWSQRYLDAPVLRDANTDGVTDDLCDDERYYFTTDANMNVTGVYLNAAPWQRYDYRAYGELVAYDEEWNELSPSNLTDCLPRYCGYWYDDETGLYCVRNRYYTPLLGRWATTDPLRYVEGASLYQYVRSRATCRTDRLGLGSVIVDHRDPLGAQRPGAASGGMATAAAAPRIETTMLVVSESGMFSPSTVLPVGGQDMTTLQPLMDPLGVADDLILRSIEEDIERATREIPITPMDLSAFMPPPVDRSYLDLIQMQIDSYRPAPPPGEWTVMSSKITRDDTLSRSANRLGFEHVDLYYNGMQVRVGFGAGVTSDLVEKEEDHTVQARLKVRTHGHLEAGTAKGKSCACARDADILSCVRSWPAPSGGSGAIANCTTDIQETTRACCLTGYTGWHVRLLFGRAVPGRGPLSSQSRRELDMELETTSPMLSPGYGYSVYGY